MKFMLNVVCVLKTDENHARTKYDITWVDKLYNNVNQFLNIPFNFVCFSNINTPYNTVYLDNNFNGFWNKVEIFRSGIFNDPVLYFDLDVIVCQDITDYISQLPPDKFLVVKEPYRDITNSSVMYFNGDYSHLYDYYINNQQMVNEIYKNPGLRFGDQAYISENVQFNYLEDYTSSGFVAWKHHKVKTEINDCSVLIFTSTEKPYNNKHLDIVKNNWL